MKNNSGEGKCNEEVCIRGRGLQGMKSNLAQQLSLGKEDHHCYLLSSSWEKEHCLRKPQINLL